MKYLVAGTMAGVLLFTALIAFIVGGLREPYVSILIGLSAVAVLATTFLRATRARRNHNQRTSENVAEPSASPLPMGPNFFIWLAIGIVIVATAASMVGYVWAAWIGYPLAIALAAFHKVLAVRRRRAEAPRTFD